MAIGRPNVMELLIPPTTKNRPFIQYSQDPYVSSLYNTLGGRAPAVSVRAPSAPIEPSSRRENFTLTRAGGPVVQRNFEQETMRTKLTLAILAAIVAMIAAQQRNRRPTTSFKKKSEGLELPNNATAIRENIVDTFSCENRIYGYYADIENDCQIFHVCLPHTRNIVRFSFICPAETVFNQATFVCTRTEGSIPCEESEKYYKLNEQFGKVEESTDENGTDSPGGEIEATTEAAGPSQRPTRPTAAPQRPTTQAPDTQTTQFTQRPPKPTQGKKRRH